MDGIRSLFSGLRWEFAKLLVQFICDEIISNSYRVNLPLNLAEVVELAQLLASELVLLSDGEGSYDERSIRCCSSILEKLKNLCRANGLTLETVVKEEIVMMEE